MPVPLVGFMYLEDVPLVEFVLSGCTSGGVMYLDVPLVEFMYFEECYSGGVYVP